MRTNRSEVDARVAELLRTAKDALGLSVTFLSRMEGPTQHVEVVEGDVSLFRVGQTQPRESSICQAILERRLPEVIPNVARFPEAKRLTAGKSPAVRSFVSVPVTLSDGSLYGTFCAAGSKRDRKLQRRDQALMQVLAQAAAAVIEPGIRERRREDEIRARLQPVIDDGGPRVVLQPIVSLADGHRVGSEALSRFPEAWNRPPDEVFAEAASIHAGTHLELLAFRRAAACLDSVTGYVAINFSPRTLMDPRCTELLADLPADRVVVELSEHDPVDDYDLLAATLEPLRAAGVRLAIDDVGSGYSSLRHIVMTAPDVIKLDRSVVAGLADDPVLGTLVTSLVEFGHSCGAQVVAEGVETAVDHAALAEAGVDCGQGWLYARPGPPEELREWYDTSGAEAVLG